MNLMNDHQDQESNKQENFSDVDSTPSLEDLEFDSSKRDTPLSPPDFQTFEKRKKSSVNPFIYVAILIISIGAFAYWGFFKDRETPMVLTSDSKGTSEEAGIVSSTEIPVEVETQDSPISEQSDQEIIAEPASGTILNTQNSSNADLQYIDRIVKLNFNYQSEDIRLVTLIVDGNSFSAEVTANSRNVLEAYFNAMKENFSGQLSLAPSPGTGAVALALVTGVVGTKLELQDWVTQTTPRQILGSVKELATASNSRVLETFIRSKILQNGYTRTPLFVKLEGTPESFQTLVSKISSSDIKAKISKVIFMEKGSKSTFVLLFEVVSR